jgi:Tfp pilus assembly protein FimT
MALGLVALLAATTAPIGTAAADRGRLRQAAMFMAAELRGARLHAILESRSVGLVFDVIQGQWTFRRCRDGNGNGLRRAEIAGGIDSCGAERVDISAMFPGVRFDVDPRVTGPDGDPGSSDPVRFGTSDIASHSPAGTCTAGSVFLTGPDGTLLLVRIAGVTGRTRVLRYDAPARAWRDE